MYNKGLISPPPWLPNNIMFEGLTGSVAYGASNDTSDMDIYGFCMPPKNMMFPHLAGEIKGFGTQAKPFEQYQKHHVKDDESRKEFDFTIFSIVKFFHLAMENNPNMVDTLFLPERCVLHRTTVYGMVRDRRKEFLHKGSWYKFRGYAQAQMKKIGDKANSSNPKRQASIEAYGYDVKFAYHVVRLLLEIEQIMAEGDLHLDRNSDVYKSIRAGEWTIERLQKYAEEKERALELLYSESKLPERPDEENIKGLLLQCMEEHYGSLSDAVTEQGKTERLVRELEFLVEKYR